MNAGLFKKLGIETLDKDKYKMEDIDIERTSAYIEDSTTPTPVIFFKDGSMASPVPSDPKIFEIKKKEKAVKVYFIEVPDFEKFKDYVLEKLSSVDIETEVAEVVEDEEVDNTEIKRLIDRIVYQAIKQGASDIHIHPKENSVKIMFRVDGILKKHEEFPRHYSEFIINKIKTMARMDATQRLIPQDGKMKLEMGENEYEFRVSTCPTVFGEDCVLRIQNTGGIFNISLEDLGFEPDDLERYKENFLKPTGMILNVGATGQGKTTTFYLTINELVKRFKGEKNIVTVEDPVEIKFKDIVQIEVDDRQGRTYPVVLRSLLRQDPDIILIGEIRDEETAEIGVRASITGHLVFATLHANDSFNAITRLRDLGLSDQLISSTLNCILSQRLVRKLCDDCKEKIETPQELKEKGIKGEHIYRAKGCEKCGYTGYRGRTAVIEILDLDEELKTAISEGSSEVALKKMARDKGFNNLWINALKKIEKGITTIEEVESVVKRDNVLNSCQKQTKADVGRVFYPDEKIEVAVDSVKGHLFDVSERGLSIVFDNVHFLTIDKPFDMFVEDKKVKFIPKSYRKLKSNKWIVGGIYKGDLSKLIETLMKG